MRGSFGASAFAKGYNMARKPILIPFHRKHGSIPWEHPYGHTVYDLEKGYSVPAPDSPYDWRAPEPFRARLRFHQVITIRSGATVRMTNADTYAEYPMKMDHFTDLIKDMVYGELPVMMWEPYKVGSNYNIRRVNPG